MFCTVSGSRPYWSSKWSSPVIQVHPHILTNKRGIKKKQRKDINVCQVRLSIDTGAIGTDRVNHNLLPFCFPLFPTFPVIYNKHLACEAKEMTMSRKLTHLLDLDSSVYIFSPPHGI